MANIKYKIAVMVPGEDREPRYEIEAESPMLAMIKLQGKFYASWQGPYINTEGHFALVSDFGREINFKVFGPPIAPKKMVVQPKKPLWNALHKSKVSGKETVVPVRGKTWAEAKANYVRVYGHLADVLTLLQIEPAMMEGL